jgi:hypothetical protein
VGVLTLTFTVEGEPEVKLTDEGTTQVGTALPAAVKAAATEQDTVTAPLNPFKGVMVRMAALEEVAPATMLTIPVVESEKDGDAVTVSGTVSVVVTAEFDPEVAVTATA